METQIDADDRKQSVQSLLAEMEHLEKRICAIDDKRTQMLNDILQLRMQCDGIIKHLDILGFDTSQM